MYKRPGEPIAVMNEGQGTLNSQIDPLIRLLILQKKGQKGEKGTLNQLATERKLYECNMAQTCLVESITYKL